MGGFILPFFLHNINRYKILKQNNILEIWPQHINRKM